MVHSPASSATVGATADVEYRVGQGVVVVVVLVVDVVVVVGAAVVGGAVVGAAVVGGAVVGGRVGGGVVKSNGMQVGTISNPRARRPSMMAGSAATVWLRLPPPSWRRITATGVCAPDWSY